jgi:hypothetical protein
LGEPAFLVGRPDDDDKAEKLAAQLGKIGEHLDLILRDLKSSAHLARVQLESIRKVPLDRRFPAKQSAEQKSRDATELSATAENLAARVKELLKRNGLISPMQAGKKTIDLLQELEKYLSHHTNTGVQQPADYPVYRPVEGSGGLPAVESVVPLITFIYVAIKYWRQRCSEKNRKA